MKQGRDALNEGMISSRRFFARLDRVFKKEGSRRYETVPALGKPDASGLLACAMESDSTEDTQMFSILLPLFLLFSLQHSLLLISLLSVLLLLSRSLVLHPLFFLSARCPTVVLPHAGGGDGQASAPAGPSVKFFNRIAKFSYSRFLRRPSCSSSVLR